MPLHGTEVACGFGEVAAMLATGNRIPHPTDMRIAMTMKPQIRLTSVVAAATIAALSGPLAADDIYRVVLSPAELDRVNGLSFPQLLLATLAVSWDLKEHDRYHCTYDPLVGPIACDHMNTTSGQYEDFYQSTMSSCGKSELCEGASLGITTWDYMASDKRICRHLITGSCVKEVLREQDVRRELLDLLAFKRSESY
jgi:hypothetical protein